MALLAYHLASGGRLAFRAAVPASAALVVAVGLSAAPAAAMRTVARILAGAPHPAAAALVAGAALTVAFWVVPRAGFGAAGWLAHLPAGGGARRRALAAAIVLGGAPLAVTAALAAVALVTVGDVGLAGAAGRVAGIAIALAGAALTVLPVRWRGVAAPLGLAATALGSWGTWTTAAIGTLLVVTADAGAGPLRPPRARQLITVPLPAPAAIALRAVAGDLTGAWAVAALPLLAGAAFLRNNTVPAPVAQGAVRLAGVLALGAVTARLAASLAVRRPVWPWMRSLPASARQRVLWDAALLAGAALPALLGTALLGPGWLAAALTLPWLALHAAGAVRRERTPEGLLFGQAAFAAAWIALVPWLGALAIAAAPLALRAAVRREKAVVAHARREGPLPGGDSLSW